MTDFVTELEQRGLLYQITSPAAREALASGSVTGYTGFDPTAPSLHVGSLLQVTDLMRLQRHGHRPIVVVGGATGLIGDPGGKESERPLMDSDTLARNLAGMRGQLERFLDFSGPRGALMVDNAEWLGRLDLLGFLREVGKHFSVNAMIARDSVRNRLETREHGISFTEFSYMLLQAYDFLALHDRYGCSLQLGGSDQWGNILSGVDLVRRKRGAEVHGITVPLVTKADGRKFGKSEQGNVWLDPEATSPYAFYQFWINVEDADAPKLLRYFSFRPLPEVEERISEGLKAPERREVQRALAAEVTDLVHGEEARRRAERTTEVLFGGGGGGWGELSPNDLRQAFAASPSSDLPREALGTPAAGLVAVLAEGGLCPSRGQAKQAIQSGAISVNDRRVTDLGYALGPSDLVGDSFVVLRRGRKSYHVVRIAG